MIKTKLAGIPMANESKTFFLLLFLLEKEL